MSNIAFGALLEALLDAFRSWDALQSMLRLQLDKHLEHLSSRHKPLPDVVHDLIDNAEAAGWKDDLLAAALRANPGNAKLRALAPTPSAPAVASPLPAASPSPPAPPMDRNALLDHLLSLNEAQFDVLCARLNVPHSILPGSSSPLATRAVELLRYHEQSGRSLQTLQHALQPAHPR